MSPGALNQQQAAEYLGIGLSTLKELEAAGEGPPMFRVGRSKRYRVSGLEAWMRARERAQRKASAQSEGVLVALDGGLA